MAKPKGLGRMGLNALLSSPTLNEQDRLSTCDITQIVPGRYQMRIHIDDNALQELAESIRAQGVIQPVIVREIGLEQYELIAGERRWRAATLAGLKEIPIVIKSIDNETALAMGLIENIQRENLNPIEEAQGLQRLADEFKLTHETIAKALGRSRSSITNSLRLLRLPATVQDLLFHKQLEMGHARALAALDGAQQLDLAKKAVKNGWSVREMEKRCQLIQQQKPSAAKRPKSPEVLELEERLTQQLQVVSEIQSSNGKSGRVVLHFDSPAALKQLLLDLGIDTEL